MIQTSLDSMVRGGCSPAPTVSIIGSAGRRTASKKMNKQLFASMVEKARSVIREDFKLELQNVHIVSGGAAWAGEATHTHIATDYHSSLLVQQTM